jgi:hypothetical protein
LKSSDIFSLKYPTPNFMKILPVKTTLIPEKRERERERETEGQTKELRQMTNLKDIFRYLGKRAEEVGKNKYILCTVHFNIIIQHNPKQCIFYKLIF